jgi:hypothetical protein
MPLAHFVNSGKIALRQRSNTTLNLCTINYAIVKRVPELDEEEAKKLYAEAVELSEANPLVTGAYAFPKDYRALCNLAMVQCMLYGNNFNSEKLPLAISPFEEPVMELWNYLKDRFPERQLVYNPNSRVNKISTGKIGAKSLIHARPVKDHNLWAGWCYVEKDPHNVSRKFKDEPYWYNSADGTEQLDAPDFAAQWLIRLQRSVYEEEQRRILKPSG